MKPMQEIGTKISTLYVKRMYEKIVFPKFYSFTTTHLNLSQIKYMFLVGIH